MLRIKLFYKILCVLVGAIIILLMLNLTILEKTTCGNNAFNLPYDIHLNWLHDSSTTMTVIWETTTLTTGSLVKYGKDTNYGQIATGTTDNQGTNGLIHIVEITGLLSGTIYHYICGDDSGGWSSDSTFITSPSGKVDFVFCSMGDSRDNPSEFNKIVSKANTVNPAFTVFTGDLCGSDNKNDYDQWFDNWEQLGNHSTIAPTIGNHESSPINYLHRFVLPNNERWYSFNYSNMHIIVLSTSEDIYSQGSKQYNWLVNDLKAAVNDPDHPWKIINFHNPPYNKGGHGGNLGVQNTISPLLSLYKVDLVFNGHNHYYERTYPLKGGGTNPVVTDMNLHYYKNPIGVIYATTGSCGAPLYDIGSAYYLAVAQKTYNYAKISVFSNNSLYMETFLDDGKTLIDYFWIEKSIGQNLPPKTPLINGTAHGKNGVTYQYTFITTDPNGDNISYLIEWGDNTNSSWIGPYLSGTKITQSHSWSNRGLYKIQARAKDSNNEESNWGTLIVIMPRVKTSYSPKWLNFLDQFPILQILLNRLRQ